MILLEILICRLRYTCRLISALLVTFLRSKFLMKICVESFFTGVFFSDIQFAALPYSNSKAPIFNQSAWILLALTNTVDLQLEKQKQPLGVFCKKSVLRNFANFTEKHLRQSLSFDKVPGLIPSIETHLAVVRGLPTKKFPPKCVNKKSSSERLLRSIRANRSFYVNAKDLIRC